MTDLTPSLTRIRAALELASKATPVDDLHVLVRYDHGGGRLYRKATPDDKHGRDLIADFYGDENNRESFYALRNCVPDIRALVEACEGMSDALKTAAKQFDFYAGQHDQKADTYEAALDPNRMLIDDTRNKAAVNRKCAAACRAALTPTPQTQDGER